MVHLSIGMAMNAQFSEHQIRTAANAELSAHVPGKHSRFLQMPLNDTSSRQQRQSSKQDIGEHFPKVSHLNNTAGLKQGPLSVNSSPVALKGHDCVISVPEMSYTSSRLLLDLLEGKPCDSESQSSTISVLVKPSTNVEMHEKNSLASLRCGQKTAQCPDYSGITYQSSSLLKMSHLLSSCPLLRKIFGGGEARPFTDEDINNVIKELFGHWKARSTKNINNAPQMDSLQKSNSIPTTKDHTERSHCAATGQCSTAAGRAMEEKSLKDSKSSSKVKDHKEKLQIVQEVAETSKRIKEESPVVAAVPEEYPSSTHSCGSSEEDWSNTDKDQHTVGKVVKRTRLDSVKNAFHCHVPTHSKTNNPKEDSMCDQTSANPSRTQDGAYLPALRPLQRHATDSDTASLDPKTTNEEQNEFHVSALSEYPLFEDISEDEGPVIATREICSLLPEPSEPSLQQHCHVQNQMANVTDVVEDKDQLDDINDNCLVIPLMISDIKFESGDSDQTDQEVADNFAADGAEHGDERRSSGPVLPQPHLPTPNPVLVSSHFSPIEVYETFESFKQANIAEFQKRDLAPESNTEHILQILTDVSSDPEDGKTEDSSDYSDESEHNYLTVSRKLLTCPPATRPSNTDESDKEKESVKRKRCKTQRRWKKKAKEDVVVLDSDGDEDCSQITNVRRYSRPKIQETVDTYYITEKSKQITPSSSYLTGPQYHSHGPETSESAIFRQNPSAENVIIIESDTEEDTDQDYGERASPVEDSEHETTQRSPKSLASSDVSHSMESGQPTDEEGKTQCLKKKAKTKRRVLIETEDSDDEMQDSVKAKNVLCKTSPLAKKKPHFGEKGTPSKLGPNPVIQRHTFAHGSNNSITLINFKPRIQKHNKTVSSETARETKKTPDSSKAHVHKDHKPNSFNDVTHTSPVSRSKRRSVSPRLRQRNNNPSALHHAHTTTKAPSSTAKPMALERVTTEWKNSYHSTRRDRKRSRETEEATPGPSRSERVPQRRPSYQESIPPLMKRSKIEARQLTANATNRIAQGERRYPVGHGYKWRMSAKGGSRKRCRSPPVCLDWDDDPSSSYVWRTQQNQL